MYEKVFNEEELKSSIELYNKIKHNKAEKERKKEKEKKELKRLCKKYGLSENTMLMAQYNEYSRDLKRLYVLCKLCESVKSETRCPLIVEKSKFLTKVFYNTFVKKEVITFYKKIKKLSKNGISFSAKNKNNYTYGILAILEEIGAYSNEYISLAIHLHTSGFFEKYPWDINYRSYIGEFDFRFDDDSYLKSLITAYKATKKYYIKGE